MIMRRAIATMLLCGAPAAAAAVQPATTIGSTVAASDTAPEARPFRSHRSAGRDVADALARAKAGGRRTLIVFGGNWCHDSRALAGWFATPRFRAMLAERYEVVWVNVGRKTRNLDLARRFGLDGIAGTPTVLMLDSAGTPLNLADAPTWRDAASRDEDAIFAHFAGD